MHFTLKWRRWRNTENANTVIGIVRYIPYVACVISLKIYVMMLLVHKRDYADYADYDDYAARLGSEGTRESRVEPTAATTAEPEDPFWDEKQRVLSRLNDSLLQPSSLNRTPSTIWLFYNRIPRTAGQTVVSLLKSLAGDLDYQHQEHVYRTPWQRLMSEEEQNNLATWFEYNFWPKSYDRFSLFINFTEHRRVPYGGNTLRPRGCLRTDCWAPRRTRDYTDGAPLEVYLLTSGAYAQRHVSTSRVAPTGSRGYSCSLADGSGFSDSLLVYSRGIYALTAVRCIVTYPFAIRHPLSYSRPESNAIPICHARIWMSTHTSRRKWYWKKLEDCVLKEDPECEFREGSEDFISAIPFLCGQHDYCIKHGNSWALQKAKFNAEYEYSVIGLVEHWNTTLAVLEHFLPSFFQGVQQRYWDAEFKDQRTVNKNPKKYKPVSETVRKILKDKMALEYELYEFLKQRLHQQFESIADLLKLPTTKIHSRSTEKAALSSWDRMDIELRH
nr:uncharacterized protein LOC113817995 [Penaeus vannamei]